jgi:hypothetical protein
MWTGSGYYSVLAWSTVVLESVPEEEMTALRTMLPSTHRHVVLLFHTCLQAQLAATMLRHTLHWPRH